MNFRIKKEDREYFSKGGVYKLTLLFFFSVLLVSGCATLPQQTPSSPAPFNPSEGAYHIVSTGQTLWRIARTYHADMHEIMRVNRIDDPSQIMLGQRLFIPGAAGPLPIESYRIEKYTGIEQTVGPRHPLSKWRTITIHHSGTLEGNAQSFDRNHRKRHMGGLFYHFVIGNGSGSGDGEVEVGWRWKRQAQVERRNDIQICLVGDFTRQETTDAQLRTLVGLVTVLCEQYDIPVVNIRRHRDIEGKATECPGTNFPFCKLVEEVQKNLI